MLLAPENKIYMQSVSFPKEYEAYLYLIKIWKTATFVKKYGGSRVGEYNSIDPTYFHSSDDIEMRKDFASSQFKIEYEVLKFGKKGEIGYAEKKMLTDAKAATSDLWYNNSNSGGRYGKGYKGMGTFNEIWNQIHWVTKNEIVNDVEEIKKYNALCEYEVKYASKEFLTKITSRYNPYQSREVQIVSSAVLDFKQLFDLRLLLADGCPPLIFLGPKKGSDELPFIWGGNLRAHGCVTSKHGDGLYYIEIPYEIWTKLLKEGGESIMKRMGNRLNKRSATEGLDLSPEDSAVWVMSHCIDNNFLRKNSKGIIVLDTSHPSIADELKECNWKTPSKRDTIKRKAQSKYEDGQNPDDSLVDFSPAGLKAKPELNKKWKEKKNIYLKEYELVIKISESNISYDKIISPIHKSGNFFKKVLIMPYFSSREARTDYKNSPPKKDGTLAGEKRLRNFIDYHMTENNVEIIDLPVTVTECEAQGYIEIDAK